MNRILLKNATLLDIQYKSTPNHSILIENDKIIAVEKGEIEADNINQEIDVRGKTLMPGLIDAHIHLAIPEVCMTHFDNYAGSYKSIHAAKMASQVFSQGFTTVREAGGVDIGLVKAIDSGLITGPRVFPAHSIITKTGGHGDSRQQHAQMDACPCHFLPSEMTLVADGISGARKAAREILRRGATQIKIASSGGIMTERTSIHAPAFSEGEIRAIVEEAADSETYVMAHAHGHEGIRRAITAGVRSIEHCSFLTDELVQLMKDHGTFMVPTLFIIKELSKNTTVSECTRDRGNVVYSAMQESLALAKHNGIEIGFGSDAFGEATPRHSEEFSLRCEVDDPYDVIISATAVNAKILQHENKLGVLKPGAFADLIIVDGDPLQDIQLLTNLDGAPIKMIMKGGKMHKQEL